MARPTIEDLQKLERRHKVQFSDLVSAVDLWHRSRNMPNMTPASRAAYGQWLLSLIVKWQRRQQRIEAKVGKSADFMKQFFPLHWWLLPDKFSILVEKRNAIDAEKKKTSGAAIGTVGFIPLIIWAVIAAITAWTAVEVTDEINNTSEEQAELVDSTNKFCTDNNLTPEQCKNLLAENTAATEGGGGGGLFKWILLGLGGVALIKYGPSLMKSSDGKKGN